MSASGCFNRIDEGPPNSTLPKVLVDNHPGQLPARIVVSDGEAHVEDRETGDPSADVGDEQLVCVARAEGGDPGCGCLGRGRIAKLPEQPR